jgi:hypothetical protein
MIVVIGSALGLSNYAYKIIVKLTVLNFTIIFKKLFGAVGHERLFLKEIS